MNNKNIVINKYSKLAIELSINDNIIDEFNQIFKNISNNINNLLLKRISNNKNIRKDFADNIRVNLGNLKINHNIIAFFYLLCNSKNILFINDIYKEFNRIINIKSKILKFNVITASDLNDSNKSQISTIINNYFPDFQVEINNEINKSIIGGFIAKNDHFIIDNSIIHHIQKVKKHLTKNI